MALRERVPRLHWHGEDDSIRPIMKAPSMHRCTTASRAALLGGLCAMLAACAVPPGGIQTAADPQDSCGPQVVVFVSAGDLFAAPPRRSGMPGAEGLADELTRENAALERLQIAFDALLYCRWTEVRVIRADATSGRFPAGELPARLGAAEARLRRDLARAGQARQNVAARSARIEAAIEAASPGTRAAVAAQRASGLSRAVASAPVVLRLRPDGTGPEGGRLSAGTQVTLRPASGGFVMAETATQRGYAPGAAFTLQTAPATAGTGDRLRSLAATNLARREGFVESLSLAERSGLQRFEPAS